MTRLFFNSFLVILACAPLAWLAVDIAQRYPLDSALIDISLIDAALLIATLSLPVCVLAWLGVDWRVGPEEYLPYQQFKHTGNK